MSKVSVAMTTYNGEQFIRYQLQSILDQSRKPDEVVIFDDGSQDATVYLVRQFISENNLETWSIQQNPENMGYVRNFRRAMSSTTGDFIFLCDQDDVWHESKIEKMVAIMEQMPEITALVCGYSLIDSHGGMIPSGGKKLYVPSLLNKQGPSLFKIRTGSVLHSNLAQGCAGVYRRNLMDAYCIAECGGILPHDWALNLMSYDNGGLYYLDQELISYRIHNSNTTGLSNPKEAIYNRIPRLIKYAQEIKETQQLPISDNAKKEFARIGNFTKTRICWLQKRNLKTWIGGFFSFFEIIKRYFFWQYMKDLALVLLKRIPANNDCSVEEI